MDLTIYDIAERVGVSAATVSRVVNNYPYVKQETRDKVLKALADLNYVPNETARSLVQQSSKIIGVLISDIRRTHHTSGVYYVEHEFSRLGYSCLIINTGYDTKQMAKSIQTLSQRKVEAVIMIGSIFQNDDVRNAISTLIPTTPVVICNGVLEGNNVYCVAAKEYDGVYDCVRFLVSKGRKNFVFVLDENTPSSISKANGFTSGCKDFSPNGLCLMVEEKPGVEEIVAITEKVIREHPEVDAMIFSEDYIASIALRGIANSGKIVPNDISIIGINNSRYAMIANPSISSIDNKNYDISKKAVDILMKVLSGDKPPKKTLISTTLVERCST